jgi:hypothetical protein
MIAYLVLGPESSGTRLLTRQLIAAGCEGSADHVQPLDTELPTAEGRAIVWRRSVPHGGAWVDISEMANRLRSAGYRPCALVCTRSWYAMTRSQVNNRHVQSLSDAVDNLRKAYPHIYEGVMRAELPYHVIGYEEMVSHPRQVLRYALDMLGWPFEAVPVRDENAKWFEE